MAASSKATRECSRAPKYSILLSNVLGVQLSPCSVYDSTETDPDDSTSSINKPQQSLSGREIFDSFVEENRSTMHTRLNETLSEVRFAGWIQPLTLLLKGPTDELDVLREAWRRRFLRSPKNFIIREIGNISSVGMDLVPQAPFLPLTKALYEAIATLNENQLPSTQKDVFQYLAHTYQYVHVPKVHVIHDCLGILIKESRVYYTGNAYYVYPDKAYAPEDTSDAKNEKTDGGDRNLSCSACEATKKKGSEGKTHKKHGTKERDSGHLCEKHKKAKRAHNHSHKKHDSSKESNRLNSSHTSKDSADIKDDKKAKRSVTSESSGSHSENSQARRPKEKQGKGNVFGQIASFIKGRKSSTSGASQEAQSERESEKEDSKITDKSHKISLVTEEEVVANDKGETKHEGAAQSARVHEETLKQPEKNLPGEFTRSKSFVRPNKKRPEFLRSNSFTAPSNKSGVKTSRNLSHNESENSPRVRTESVERPSSALTSTEYYRPPPKGQEMPPTQPEETNFSRYLPAKHRNIPGNRNSTCAVGIVRPMHTHAQSSGSESRSLSRSSSVKEHHRYSTPSFGTPHSDQKGSGSDNSRNNFNRSVSMWEQRSFEYTPIKIAKFPERDFSSDSPLKQLLTKNTGINVPLAAPGHNTRYTSTPSGSQYASSSLPSGSQYASSSLPSGRSQSSSRSTLQHSTPLHSGSQYAGSQSSSRSTLQYSTPLHSGSQSSPRSTPQQSTPLHSGSQYASDLSSRGSRSSSRSTLQHRHSFHGSSNKRSCCRTPVRSRDDGYDVTKPDMTSYKKIPTRDELCMSPICYDQSKLVEKVGQCKCSDSGCCERYESSVTSSDHRNNGYAAKDEISSVCTRSDDILLDEISSSASSTDYRSTSRLKQIDNDSSLSPFVAEGQVILDSSLTFIGII